MHNKDVMALVRACISVGEKFKIILDEETDVLRKNDLVQIVRMNNRKEDLIREFLQVKEDVLLKVAAIVAEHGAEIAFPTQTVHLQMQNEPSL